MDKTGSTTLVKITERDLQLLQTLNAAGWLNTRQIRDRFFHGKTTHAVCKRLRKLIAGKYVGMARHNSTECALYRLAGQGKLTLIEHSNLDALARIRIADQESARDMDVAIEFDAGTEHASFFGKTKIAQYATRTTEQELA